MPATTLPRLRRTIGGELTLRLSLMVLLAAVVLGAGYYLYSTTTVSRRLAAEAAHTADELAQVLVLPLYNIDDEAVRRAAKIYIGSGRVRGVRVTSTISGVLFDNLASAGSSSSLPPIDRGITRDGLELGHLTLLFDDAPYLSARKRAVWTTAVVTLAGIVLIGGVLRLVLRPLVTEPLNGIIQRLDEIARGNYEGRLAPVPQEELNAIVTAANRMSDEIADRSRRLAESEQIHREIFNATSDAIFIHDAETGDILDVNQTMLDMYGYSREDIEEMAQCNISGADPPYTWDEARRRLRLAAEGEPQLFEWRAMRKNGERFWVEVALKRTRLRGKAVVLAVVRDITERKELEAELRQAQKIEAMGVLAGGIAHDFNNILSAIFGYTELAQLEAEPGSRLAEDLKQIEKASERARDLVRQILTFSRRQEQEKKPLRLALVVKEALQFLRSSIPATIDIRRRIDEEAMIMGDPGQMHQLLVNLCTNAYHAMEAAGGTLTVTLAVKDIGRRDLPAAGLDKPGRYVVAEVSDTGHGIDPAIMDKIFEPYFTTKEKDKGTGLGLAVADGIVRSHKGRVTVYSELGRGTTFRVYLPAIDRGPEPAGQDDAPLPPGGGHGRILVVDDEESIRVLSVKFLEEAGYEVTACANGDEAWRLLRDGGGDFDLLITDLTMPVMTGVELAAKAMRLRPDLPVILCTGFSEQLDGRQAREMGVRAYLHKPLTSKELLATVHRVLAGGA